MNISPLIIANAIFIVIFFIAFLVKRSILVHIVISLVIVNIFFLLFDQYGLKAFVALLLAPVLSLFSVYKKGSFNISKIHKENLPADNIKHNKKSKVDLPKAEKLKALEFKTEPESSYNKAEYIKNIYEEHKDTSSKEQDENDIYSGEFIDSILSDISTKNRAKKMNIDNKSNEENKIGMHNMEDDNWNINDITNDGVKIDIDSIISGDEVPDMENINFDEFKKNKNKDTGLFKIQ